MALNNSKASHPDAPVTPKQDSTEEMDTSDAEQSFTTSAQANHLSQLD
jgi:hypothetical protein